MASPRHIPLFVSSIDPVGTVLEDPLTFTGQSSERTSLREFEVRLKCWWSPNNTDCFFHNEHPFLEVHTQIHGHGRMQKFRERDALTLYEETHMVPGFTHEAFCTCARDGAWTYPWHRYFTDLESIWLAVELHPV